MIISFRDLGSFGRLGNQLFQLSSTMGLAEHYGAKASFPKWSYESYFENVIPHGELLSNTVTELYYHHYDWNLTESCNIRGYLQSEKYFGSFRLKLKQSYVDELKKKVPIFDKETICIHIRRGDYVKNPNYFQIPIMFYISSLIKYFPQWELMNVLIISDDIEYCKVHFESLPNVTFHSSSDIEDMALGSCCDHFIISNGSYGWWTAYLGEKPHSKIIHCGRVFGDVGKLSKNDTKDFWPERWVEYRHDSYKIPLRDVTFTIPVKMDHVSRKENLDLTLYMLQSCFESNYMVCEQGGAKFKYVEQWATYIQFRGDKFHRTKMLNDMAKASVTPYVANWDCDVIIPPMQVYLSTLLLRRGADMVYPYSGPFARMPRNPWYQELNKFLDIGIARNTEFKGRSVDHGSVGGAVMWDKESFINGGMENEHMVSFGPEDVERYERFSKLGYKIERANGALFHVNHFVGPDSSPANPLFDSNNKELDKIRRMTVDQLLEYVSTWGWCHRYTTEYYGEISEGAIRSAKEVFDNLGFKPKSVIDVGCGLGEWNNGISEYCGIDYHVDKSKLLFPMDHYIECNLNKNVPIIKRKYDLCLCLEVAEHLDQERADSLVKFLCSLSNKVLFSAAIPYQGGNGHRNEQWQTWWALIFDKYGFGPAQKQPEIRCNENIELWYRQNAILYEKGGIGEVHDFILPEYYVQIIQGIKNSL